MATSNFFYIFAFDKEYKKTNWLRLRLWQPRAHSDIHLTDDST